LRTVLSNAGPLIALGKLGRLALLPRLYPGLSIPRTVYQEVVAEGIASGAPDAFMTRLLVERYRCPIVEASREVFDAYVPGCALDAGEREVLALARGTDQSLVLMDDELARAESRRLGIPAKGTLGVLVEAHRSGLLTLDEIEILLLTITARPDIWISAKLCRQILAELGRPEPESPVSSLRDRAGA
jgi:predicted nucleic acid-binding protein